MITWDAVLQSYGDLYELKYSNEDSGSSVFFLKREIKEFNKFTYDKIFSLKLINKKFLIKTQQMKGIYVIRKIHCYKKSLFVNYPEIFCTY